MNKTRNILSFFAFALLLSACTIDDEVPTTFTYELVPVDSVSIPGELDYLKTYTFDIVYERPTSCHDFAGFSYEKEGHERIIAVINAVYEIPDCEDLAGETAVAELDFVAERQDYYVFKFWQGETGEGEAVFLTDTVYVNLE